MIIQNSFVVPVDRQRVWDHLVDLERIVPCIPGARVVETIDAATWQAEMSLKLGPMALAFAGRVVLKDRDDAAFRMLMVAEGKDRKGKGSATMRSASQLSTVEDGTMVSLHQDIVIRGTIAQFGQGVMQDVSNRMIEEFAAALEQSIMAPRARTGGPEEDVPSEGQGSLPSADQEHSRPAVPRQVAGPPAVEPVSALRLVGIALRGALKRLFTRRSMSG